MTQGDTIGAGASAAAADTSHGKRSTRLGRTTGLRTVATRDGWLRPEATRLPSLTGLRFPAALLVFLNHTGLPFPFLRLVKDDDAAMDWFDLTRNAGALGVTFFFVLSGFVLTWAVRETDTIRAFWRRRIVKIYPNYAITWGLAMVLFASAYTPARTAVLNLLMVHVWVPEFDVFSSVNQPSWSLGCELLFYLSFPLLHKIFRRIKAGHLKYWISGVTAAIIATPFFTYLLLPDDPNFPGGQALGARASTHQYWFAYNFPPMRLLDFALGMLVAQAVLHGRWWNIGMTWSGLLLAGSYVWASHVPFLYSQRSMTIVPIIFLIAAAATADARNQFTLFRNRAMIWLGEVSFAFYLVHFVVLAYVRKWLGHEMYSVPQTVGIVLVEFTIALLASWALYALIERPLTRNWSKPRHPKAAAS
ncbi:acyltransferase [Streptomyces sp. TLI_146]|uniref:acyltransferase family protein n=1 Tax=Streptomyces sp. TLI_146 TaxID=1938858 RepID=UPI000C70C421|nr:acyltransferase [Streptomyces sp. TLI_146]